MRRWKRYGFVGLALAALSAPGWSALLGGPVPSILYRSATPAELRQQLGDFARQRVTADPREAAEAAYYVGVSWSEEGQRDSAAAWLAWAVRLRGRAPELAALADQRLAAGTREAGETVVAMLRDRATPRAMGPGPDLITLRARLGWAYYLAGFPDSAAMLLREATARMKNEDDWLVRLALAEQAAGQIDEAVKTVGPLAERVRGADPRVMALLRRLAGDAGASQLEGELGRLRALFDQRDRAAARALGADLAEWRGRDGFRLHGYFLPRPTPGGRRPGAVILMDPASSPAECDSLALTLNRQGFPVLIAEPRGTGGSRDSLWCAPYSWRGREELARVRTMEDVRRGLSALGRQPRVDTTSFVLVGLKGGAPAVLEAASRDPRVRAVVIVTPRPSPTELGPMRAAVERLRCPLYLQTAPEEFEYEAYADSLYRLTDPRFSRLVGATVPGSGAAIFQSEDRIRTLLAAWLRETFPAKR